jgi:hypothetical protein
VRAATLLLHVLAAVVVVTGAAHAHDRSVSYSDWTVDGDRVTVRLRAPVRELTRLGLPAGTVSDLVREAAEPLAFGVVVRRGNHGCRRDGSVAVLPAALGQGAWEWTLVCEGEGDLTARMEVFVAESPGHLHFLRVPGSEPPVEAVVTAASPQARLTAASGATERAPGLRWFLGVGFAHILSGYDHLLFLLALLLLAPSIGDVARVVTGFTVAHSLTLAIAAWGLVRPDTSSVEALIALSIALLAVENFWIAGDRDRRMPWLVAGVLSIPAGLALLGRGNVAPAVLAGLALFSLYYFELALRMRHEPRLRWGVAFLFGLVHGFGFAGFLVDSMFARASVVEALLGFNLGVETGQILVVALLWPLLRAAARMSAGRYHEMVVTPLSVLLLVVGTAWFAIRVYG